MIDYRILGPLEVSADGRVIEIGGPKLRALLLILLLRDNEAVSRDVLVHELWGEQPPDGAQHTLDVYISRLRKALDAAANGPVVVTLAGAYSLQLAMAPGCERLRAPDPGRQRSAGREGADQAAVKFRAALRLWRGPALADLANGPGPRADATRLEELRLGAMEDRIEADLALGRHKDVVGELQALVAVHPLRERLHGQLMIALYRDGRQAEALEAYQAARRTLVEELGLEPSPALQRLERAILQQDASLDLPDQAPGVVPVTGTGQPRLIGSGRKIRALAITGALAVASALLVAATTHGPGQLAAGPNTVGMIDGGQARLTAVVSGVGRPDGVASGAGAIWITDSADNMLLRVDPAGQVIDRIPVGRGPAGVAVADGEVWVANELDGNVSEVNPGSGTQVAVIPAGIGPDAIASGYGSVWVANVTSDTVSRINAATGDVMSTISLSGSPVDIAVGAGAVWATAEPASWSASTRATTGLPGPSPSARAQTASPSELAASGSRTRAARYRGSTREPARCGPSRWAAFRPASHLPMERSGSPAPSAEACPGSIHRQAWRSSSRWETSRRYRRCREQPLGDGATVPR